MNKAGFTFPLVLMLAVVCFMMGLALADPITEVINEQMTDLGCNTPTSDFIKGTCFLMDLNGPLFIAFLFALGGAILGGVIL